MTNTAIGVRATDAVGEELALAHDKIANLEIALKSSRRIGMAIGVLMAQHKIREGEAFEILRVGSQLQHRKLRDLAEDVILAGVLGGDSHEVDARPALLSVEPGPS
jgi:AmiR/NasT family two-component response regulator